MKRTCSFLISRIRSVIALDTSSVFALVLISPPISPPKASQLASDSEHEHVRARARTRVIAYVFFSVCVLGSCAYNYIKTRLCASHEPGSCTIHKIIIKHLSTKKKQLHDTQNHYQASQQKVKRMTQKEVEWSVEEAKLRYVSVSRSFFASVGLFLGLL